MSLIRVQFGPLESAGAGIASVGHQLSETAGLAGGSFCLAAPAATATALAAFQARWGGVLAEMGGSIERLGLGLDLAADAYRDVDTGVMPS